MIFYSASLLFIINKIKNTKYKMESLPPSLYLIGSVEELTEEFVLRYYRYLKTNSTNFIQVEFDLKKMDEIYIQEVSNKLIEKLEALIQINNEHTLKPLTLNVDTNFHGYETTIKMSIKNK